MKKIMVFNVVLVVLIFTSCSKKMHPEHQNNISFTKTEQSQDGFQCGFYGPNVTLRTTGDFGKMITALFTSSGDQTNAIIFINSSGSYFLDEMGAGALMGCYPVSSKLYTWGESIPRKNYYNAYGMLQKQDTIRFVDNQEVPYTLNYSYTPSNPYRVAYAEQFCFSSIDIKLTRLTFTYNYGKLVNIKMVSDSGCPNPGTYNFTYSYEDPNVPNMPTKEIMTGPEDNRTDNFSYTVNGQRITSIASALDSNKLSLFYNAGDKLEKMNLQRPDLPEYNFLIFYNTVLEQWTALIAQELQRGLAVLYDSQNRPIKSRNNMGYPTPDSDYSEYEYLVPNNGGWQEVGGNLKQVSVGNDGTIWGVNAYNDIWRYNGSGWTQVTGKLIQVSVGNANNIWGVNSNNDIWKYNGSGWTQVSGKLKYVSAASDGTVWGINSNNDIFRYLGNNTWETIPGKLKQISVGNANNIYGVNSDDDVFKYSGGGVWQKLPGKLSQISAAADGTLWGCNSSRNVWRWNNGAWESVSGSMKQVSDGNANAIWAVDFYQKVWKYVGGIIQ